MNGWPGLTDPLESPGSIQTTAPGRISTATRMMTTAGLSTRFEVSWQQRTRSSVTCATEPRMLL